MKILLASIPIEKRATFGGVDFAAPHIPSVGLAYIAAVLEKNNHKVKIIDCMIEGINTYKDLKTKIKEFNPDLIGFSIYTATYGKAQDILKLLKKDFPDIKVVFGGPHITALPEQTMEETPLLDYVIPVEGEYTLLELAQGKDLKDILGLVYREKNKMIKNPPRPLVETLDELPHPARHLLLSSQHYHDLATRSIRGIIVTLITSRGCPSNCHFCDQTMGKKWRGHSVDYIFEEIDSIKENIAKIDFEDDNFALNRKRLEEFCRKKIERGDKWKWNCYMRLDSMDDDIISLMKKAGCYCIFVGIESGNNEMLKFINKNITTDLIRKKINILKKHKVEVHGSIILGYPKETKKTLKQTIDFALFLPLDGITVNIFTPFPKTVLAEKAGSYGVVSNDWADYSPHSPKPAFVPNGFTAEELLELQRNTYKRFFFRPKFILTHLNKFFNKQFFITGLKALRYFLWK